MSIFENIQKTLTDTAKAAAKKSSDLVEVTKLAINVGAEEDKIRKVLLEIGKVVYDSYKLDKDSCTDEFKQKCELIESYENNIKSLKQKIMELKKIKLCNSCKKEIDEDAVYCPNCGAKQETKINKVQENENQDGEESQKIELTKNNEADEKKEKVCPACGSKNLSDVRLCSVCGNVLDEE